MPGGRAFWNVGADHPSLSHVHTPTQIFQNALCVVLSHKQTSLQSWQCLVCPQSVFVTKDQKGSCSEGPTSWCFLGIVLKSSESLTHDVRNEVANVICNFKYIRDWIFCTFFYATLAIVLALKRGGGLLSPPPPPPPPPPAPASPFPYSAADESIRLLSLSAWILDWIRLVSFCISV